MKNWAIIKGFVSNPINSYLNSKYIYIYVKMMIINNKGQLCVYDVT